MACKAHHLILSFWVIMQSNVLLSCAALSPSRCRTLAPQSCSHKFTLGGSHITHSRHVMCDSTSVLCLQDASKQMQDMQLDAASMKRRLVELHSNETAMVSEAVQLRTELARTQGELTKQVELTREAQASEAAMQARLSAEEKNNAALKAALDIQTQVSLLLLV